MRPDAADRAAKRARVLAILDDAGARSVHLTSAAAVTWYLDGARTHVSLAADPIVSVVVDRDTDLVLATSNETARLVAEELPDDVVVAERSWFDGVAPTGGLREADLDGPLRAARQSFLPTESARFAALGVDAARAATDALMVARAEHPERRLAGEVAARLVAAGADPLVVLVAGSTRLHLRHPLPTGAPLGGLALVVVCARRHGLIANLSRWVAFEEPDATWSHAADRLLKVEAAAFAASIPGASVGEVLRAIAAAYPANGFAEDEWMRHHQGGTAGYAGRDPRATPGGTDVLVDGQHLAWNPSAPAVKVEDTVRITGGAVEPITVDPRWPTVTVDGVARPTVLRR